MIETNRLLLRPFKMSDIENAFEWLGDAEVMKYIPGGPDKKIEDSRNRISKYIDLYTRDGFSKYVIFEKSFRKLIGDCGILRLEDSNLNELGFRISKNYWHMGYATESARAVLKYAFDVLNFNEIHAVVESANKISQYMIKNKLGFSYLKNTIHFGIEMELYCLEKKDFRKDI
jgi:[ribosomal protein S5]-alanine N-acetyltransferase